MSRKLPKPPTPGGRPIKTDNGARADVNTSKDNKTNNNKKQTL